MTRNSKGRFVTVPAVFEPTQSDLWQLALAKAFDALRRGDEVGTPDVVLDASAGLYTIPGRIDALLDAKARKECKYEVSFHQRLRRAALKLLRECNAFELRLALSRGVLSPDLQAYGQRVLTEGSPRAVAYTVLVIREAIEWEMDYDTFRFTDDDAVLELTLAQEERGERVYHHTPTQPKRKRKAKQFAVDTIEIRESDLDKWIKLDDGSWVLAIDNPTREYGEPFTKGDPRGYHREGPAAKRVKRWAYCTHCTEQRGEAVWYETAAQRGKARHTAVESCKKVEGKPPERDYTPQVEVSQRVGNRIVKRLFQKNKRGQWFTMMQSILEQGKPARTQYLGERCWAELAEKVQKLYVAKCRR